MGVARSSHRARFGAGLAWLVLAGCQLAPAKVWNLAELHEANGRPQHEGRLKSDLGYFLDRNLRSTGFGGPEFQAAAEQLEAIEDPLGECFENVRELAHCERDEKVASLQAAAFAWLAVDCTYPLSRERCALELGALARALGLAASLAPPEAPATAEEVHAAYEQLGATLRETLAAPALAGSALGQVAERVRGLALDRDGALRLLRAVNAWLAEGERGAVLAPLRELRLELARRSTALALHAALGDTNGRVRAAALEAHLLAFAAERGARLAWALSEPMTDVDDREIVRLRALEFLARYGLPPPAPGEEPPAFERALQERLVEVLRQRVDGPQVVAACRALARLSGEPATLRPEVWLARWRAEAAAREPEARAPGTPP